MNFPPKTKILSPEPRAFYVNREAPGKLSTALPSYRVMDDLHDPLI